MAKRYALKTERTRKHPKTGAEIQDVSFYKGPIMGIAHEWTNDPKKARAFHGRALAELYAKNKGIRYDTVASI